MQLAHLFTYPQSLAPPNPLAAIVADGAPFAAYYQQAHGEEKVQAAEDLARAMRAADAGTGRALAFLESLDAPTERPKP